MLQCQDTFVTSVFRKVMNTCELNLEAEQVTIIRVLIYNVVLAGFNFNYGLNRIHRTAMKLLRQSQLHNHKFPQPIWFT